MNNDLMTASDNVDTVKEVTKELKRILERISSCTRCLSIKDEQGLQESTLYFNSVKEHHRTRKGNRFVARATRPPNTVGKTKSGHPSR